MGKARNKQNPDDRYNLRSLHATPGITKKQHNQPQPSYAASCHLKRTRKAKHHGNANYVACVPRRRFLRSPSPIVSVRPLSPLKDDNGHVMSKEQQDVFFRNKVDAFEMRIPVMDNLETPKNMLAIVAGLTDEPNYADPVASANPSDDSGCDVMENPPKRRSQRKSPKLPVIVVQDGGMNDDIICLNPSRRARRSYRGKKNFRSQRRSRIASKPVDIPLIELDSDSDDSGSVICLGDNGEEDFANLSITTTVATSSVKTTITKNNGASTQAITSQQISKTTTTVISADIRTPSISGSERHVRHYRRSPYPLAPLEAHQILDSLTYYLSMHKNHQLRSQEVIGPHLHNPDAMKSFRVISYNVLCQATMMRTRYLYQYMDSHPEMFQWQYRWDRLSKELVNLDADIYCLQEVERDKVVDFYEPLMVGHKQRKSFYAWRGDDQADGCAIYWNPLKFDAVKEVTVPLNHDVPNLDKPNTAQILCLLHKYSGKELIVVNTHILFNPKRGDIKLYQLAVIFANLHKVRTNNQPVIFCGDFNLEPDSILYKFITDGHIDCSKTECFPSCMSRQKRIYPDSPPMTCFSIPEISGVSRKCSFDKDDKECGHPLQSLQHCFNFESVYGRYSFEGNRVVSTYHQDQGNPDFIFYTVKQKTPIDDDAVDVTEADIFLSRRLSLPDAIAMERYSGPLPHCFSSSDHLPLYAEFYFS